MEKLKLIKDVKTLIEARESHNVEIHINKISNENQLDLDTGALNKCLIQTVVAREIRDLLLCTGASGVVGGDCRLFLKRNSVKESISSKGEIIQHLRFLNLFSVSGCKHNSSAFCSVF